MDDQRLASRTADGHAVDERSADRRSADGHAPDERGTDERGTDERGTDGRIGGAQGRDVAELEEYLAGGLREVRCEACGRRVRAGKRSAMQTSVQWSGPACERLAAVAGGRPTALVPTCPELRESIDRAVREGRLEVS
ncbi:hypothetical protein [Actinoplanes philippinensis]|uniref:hypothetical protein n=1 Tax=Actinoplanes philippinensis TaxID=35752 RepID=UPI001EF1BFC8|nr:hypothetical protein [Actinoplanes philippinensis]